MQRQSVLVTGGSGFLGHNLCRYLLKKGFEVRSIDIASFDYPDLTGKVKVFDGNICDTELLNKAMDDADFVVHCAAALPLWKKEDIIKSNVDGTRNVMEAALQNNVKRVVHISSTAVFGVPDHAPLVEDDEMHGVGWYGKTKITSEEICLDYRKKGMCIPILRPVSFIGPGRLGIFAILFDWVRRGKNIPLIGNGKNKYQLMNVDDLSDAIYLCMTLPEKTVNDTFNIGSEDFGTMHEDFGALVEYAGFGRHVIKTPAWLVISILRILELLKLSPIYKWIYECAVRDCYVSNEKIKKKLGWKARHSNRESLIRTYEWYLKNYKGFNKEYGVTHRMPWKQGALKVIRKFF